MILYLHGFRSSPQSTKARLMADGMAAQGRAAEFLCPALPVDPAAAMSLCGKLVEQCHAKGRAPTVVGSSLGGYYATWLAEQYDLKAVLINPAVLAPLSLSVYVGTQTHFHSGESFEFTTDHVDALRQLEVARLTPSRYLLLLEKGDEVLDWALAARRYAGCQQVILEGGDHSFTRFADYLPTVLGFARTGKLPAASCQLSDGRI